MSLDSRLPAFRTALLGALGFLPVVACGGSTSSANDADGQGGGESITGGATSGGTDAGAGTFTGGKASAGTGGRTTGGDSGTGGTASSFECVPRASGDRPAGGSAEIVAPKPEPFVECEGGWRHRPLAQECPSRLPRADEIPGAGLADECTSDADCTARDHGWCATASEGNNQSGGNLCLYGCVSDDDCSAGTICECGTTIGRCVPSNCTTDADCDGTLCASYVGNLGCDFPAFACQTREDRCMSDDDCEGGLRCTIAEGGTYRECKLEGCAVGRPFLVDGELRVAEVAPRHDWLAELEPPCLDGLSKAALGELAEAWTRIGLLEHASVAAFARFSLELLAFGAPAELVAKSASAMSDETEHARQAFALASAYAGAPRGPGVLAVDGGLLASRLEDSVLTALVEGCIGETVAALEAREAADGAIDRGVRAVLTRVADEEGRHALLAYEFVKWALTRCSASLGEELAALLDRAVEQAARERDEPLAPGPVEHELLAHGILPASRRRALRCEVLAEVVIPCVRALLDGCAQRRAASMVIPYSAVSSMIVG